ncbi:MAG: hypothetical protein P8Y80_14495 [Acidobacteriota bacterium]|jgi:hypothetical protein
MEKMKRRSFCGASLMALPLMKVFAEDSGINSLFSQTNPVLDTLADEFTRTTLNGVRNGFRAYHFRQYATQVRIFNACLDAEGVNDTLNGKLDEEDYYLLNAENAVQFTVEYWKKHGVLINEDDLAYRMAIDENSYKMTKKAIKKMGGVQKLNERIAQAFERRAEKYTSNAYHSGLTINNGSIKFPVLSGHACKTGFRNVQYEDLEDLQNLDPHLFVDLDIDCLCKAMLTEGALLTIGCVTICQPCCVPAGILLGIATLMEELGFCDSDKC